MTSKKHYTGLTEKQVEDSRLQHGNNYITPPQKAPAWKLFFEKFQDPIIRILLIAAFLSLIISVIHNEYTETIGIFCAIFLATGIAFWFEMDANKKFDVLNQADDEEPVMVIRDGNVREVQKKDIVVGDVVILETGNEVPADGELLESISLQINESTLTGEPSIDKTTDPAHFELGVTYPSNYVLRSTKVINGHGICVIRKVGDNTEFGKVAQKSTEKVEGDTPLNKQLNTLARFIGVVGLSIAFLTFSYLFIQDLFFNPETNLTSTQLGLLGAVMFGLVIALAKIWVPLVVDGASLAAKNLKVPEHIAQKSWLRWIVYGSLTTSLLVGVGYFLGADPTLKASWIDITTANRILQYFMVAVTLVVVAVPEGLPMSVTLSLAMSMRRMLKSNNLVRKIHACETMGAATVICTDKTGTLTQNQMQIYQTDFHGLAEQTLKDDDNSRLIIENISANSTAYLDYSQKDKVSALGNPTEGALLLWLNKHEVNYLEVREDSTVKDQIPFSTERKYMATLVDSGLLKKKVIYLKGAPEVILSKCRYIQSETGVKTGDLDCYKQEINDKLLQYQNQAMRTLGFAYSFVDDKVTSIDSANNAEFTFMGIVAISDPIRSDVPAAVTECLHAGIQVKVVTGDTYATAREIGREIGIWNPQTDTDLNIISGEDFEKLSDDEARKRIGALKIMCRARPTDKQRLVSLLKESGEIVAVTGDGTNDAPALNHADVGLSMGSGTSVAKEASDITLLDDSFKSIATAVMWGRSLYQNIQRFLIFQLTINLTALLVVFVGSMLGQESPLTVTQMLWVNLIMDTFAAGALASLPPNPNVMYDPPRNNQAFIITPLIGKWIVLVGLFFIVLLLSMLIYFDNPHHMEAMFPYIPSGERQAYFLSYFFTVFVLLQFWNLFNAKAFASGTSAFKGLSKSKGFLAVLLLILIGQFMIVTFGGEAFQTVPLCAKDWGIIIGGTSVVLWLGEILRLFGKKKAI